MSLHLNFLHHLLSFCCTAISVLLCFLLQQTQLSFQLKLKLFMQQKISIKLEIFIKLFFFQFLYTTIRKERPSQDLSFLKSLREATIASIVGEGGRGDVTYNFRKQNGNKGKEKKFKKQEQTTSTSTIPTPATTTNTIFIGVGQCQQAEEICLCASGGF